MSEIQKNFNVSVLLGELVERRVMELLPDRSFKNPVQTQGHFKPYDIKTDQGTFEIKYDDKSKATGNFFFETYFKGKKSGIAATQADYYVMVEQNMAHVALTHHVRDFLRSNWEYLKKVENCGDDGMGKGILVPCHLYTSTRVSGLAGWRIDPELPDKETFILEHGLATSTQTRC